MEPVPTAVVVTAGAVDVVDVLDADLETELLLEDEEARLEVDEDDRAADEADADEVALADVGLTMRTSDV